MVSCDAGKTDIIYNIFFVFYEVIEAESTKPFTLQFRSSNLTVNGLIAISFNDPYRTPGLALTTITVPWKPYVWFLGLPWYIHKTIQKLNVDHKCRLLDHAVQRIYRSCQWPSTRRTCFLWCLLYHIQDYRLLWPIQDPKTFFCEFNFWLKRVNQYE